MCSEAISSIYFLHRGDKKQAWRYLDSDEVFMYCSGAPIHVHTIEKGALRTVTLGPRAGENGIEYLAAIPANVPFTAECLDNAGWTLTACVVAPGAFVCCELGAFSHSARAGWKIEDYHHMRKAELVERFPALPADAYERFYAF